jgi:hypothetical protein
METVKEDDRRKVHAPLSVSAPGGVFQAWKGLDVPGQD